MKKSKLFVFASRLTCIITLAAVVALASPVSMTAQVTTLPQVDVQKPLVLFFTAIFAPKVGEGPSIQYEFQADSFLLAARVAMAWGKEYCPQNVLVSLVPRSVAPQETLIATFEPKVGDGPSLQYEFQLGDGPSVLSGFQAERFLRAIRIALLWGKEYCPQNVLVSLVPKAQGPQETNSTQEAVTPIVPVNSIAQVVFTARFLSRDSGLVIQQEVRADSFLRAARATLAWSKVHCPEYVLLSLVQNERSVQ